MPRAVLLSLVLPLFPLLAAPCAAQGPVSLYCARGAGDYPDAAMTLKERGSHVVNVVFVGYRPSRVRADWSLRDCLYTASRLDGSRDIEAALWYRERGERLRREPLEPRGAIYRASTRTVVLQGR